MKKVIALFTEKAYLSPNERYPYLFNDTLQGKKGTLYSVGTFRSLFGFLMGDFQTLVMRDVSPKVCTFNRLHIKILKTINGLPGKTTEKKMEIYQNLLQSKFSQTDSTPSELHGLCTQMNTLIVSNARAFKDVTKLFSDSNHDTYAYWRNVMAWEKLIGKIDKIEIEQGSIFDQTALRVHPDGVVIDPSNSLDYVLSGNEDAYSEVVVLIDFFLNPKWKDVPMGEFLKYIESNNCMMLLTTSHYKSTIELNSNDKFEYHIFKDNRLVSLDKTK